MDKKMKSGFMKSLTRNQMKKVLGGLEDGGGCSGKCDLNADGTRKKCATGCICDSSEERPCIAGSA